MDECALCKKHDKDLTLLSANHKKFGRILVCQECWANLYDENLMVCDATGSDSSCPTCNL